MSEFQLYDFRRIDRALTREEMQAVARLSSHIKVSTHRAVVFYAYGSFKHNEEQILEQYFDAFVRQNNWGQKKLMFRVPNEHLNFEELKQYNIDGGYLTGFTTYIEIVKKMEYTLILIEYCDEDSGGDWIDEDDDTLDDLLPLRAALMEGDYACLYAFLLKLKAIEVRKGIKYNNDDYNNDNNATLNKLPPVPSGLANPDSSLDAFISFFEIDTDIVAAAGSFSVPKTKVFIDYPFLIKKMKEDEKNEWLNRLINNELHLDLKLKKHFEIQDANVPDTKDAIVTYEQIEARTGEARKKRLEKEAQAAKVAYANRMANIKKEELALWKEAESCIETAGAKSYDNATKNLKDLYDMALFYNQNANFMFKYKPLLEKSYKSKVLLDRYRKAGLPL